MPNFDPEFSLPPERRLIASGCVLRLGTAAAAIRGNDRAEYVELSDGSALPAELVILATGMRPRVSLAVAAGLKTGETGSLYVDERMRTSDPAIFAAGDMTESIHRISGKRTNVPLAGPANKQGRIAGANVVAVTNAADSGMKYAGVLGTSVIRLYDLTAARTGLSETEAKRAGIDCCSVYAPAASHASYYPNAGWIILKLTSERSTGKLLGAQAIGSEGVEKRIDVLATALYAGLSVYDLENLDLCYSPPYSSAKDPVNTAGMIASDALRGDVKIVQPSDLKEFLADTGAILVDIRTPQEWRNGIIQGALTIELDALRAEPSLLDRAETYVLYCGVGYRAYIACRFLSQLGYNVYNLTGGWNAYGMDV
jgi:rhodanese-related sulfurtransferase